MSVADLIDQWSKVDRTSLDSGQVNQLLAEAGLNMGEPGTHAVELRIAVEQDILFGHIIAFSFGRMALDIWGDVAYRIVPLTEKDARLIVREPSAADVLLQGYELLDVPDICSIQDLILKLSDIVYQNPRIREIELHPVYASSDGIVVKCASVELEPKDFRHE